VRTEYYDVRGLRLAVHRLGSPQAPAVLCLHGFLDSGLSFRPIAERLVAAGLQVLAPDFRGFGHSGWIGDGGYYHFYDYWSDMTALVAHNLAGPFHLVGHSMGGSVAVGMVALGIGEVRTLVLLEGLGPPFDQPDRSLPRLRRWLGTLGAEAVSGPPAARALCAQPLDNLDAAAARLRRHNPSLAPDRALQIASDLTREPPDGLEHGPESRAWRHDPLHLTPAAKPFLADSAHRLWQAVTVPTLALYGQCSEHVAMDLRARAAHLPHALLGTVPQAGHNLHHDQPELMAAAIIHHVGGGHDQLVDGLLPGLPTAP
jgi:pimeloyl-ACP methyl ester carboxylesterase